MGPAPGLGTHAHCTTDGPQVRAKHRGPGTGRPTTESQPLKIPPYKGLAEWESRTAPDRGRNLRDLVE